jgi:hypothetical protein
MKRDGTLKEAAIAYFKVVPSTEQGKRETVISQDSR